MAENDWGITAYPFVPGHEVVRRIAAVGEQISHLKIGQSVGVGWTCRSCLVCDQCMSGNHHRCAQAVGTIVRHHGGFANKVRSQAAWTFPIPDSVDRSKAGPLFCGGITVFNPLMLCDVSPHHALPYRAEKRLLRRPTIAESFRQRDEPITRFCVDLGNPCIG